MDIRYLGHSCFLIKSKKTKIITDPFDPKMVGINLPRLEADIITISHQHDDHNHLERIKNQPLVIDLPGEYEKNEVFITGYPSFHDDNQGKERGENIIFKIEVEGVNILHCGDLGHELSDDLVEQISDIDILLIPTGGYYTIGPEQAVRIVNAIEPKIVVPMHFNHERLNPQVFGKLAPVKNFIEKLGLTDEDITKKDKLTEKDIPDFSEKQVVILSF